MPLFMDSMMSRDLGILMLKKELIGFGAIV